MKTATNGTGLGQMPDADGSAPSCGRDLVHHLEPLIPCLMGLAIGATFALYF
jgi:hypothetical protein